MHHYDFIIAGGGAAGLSLAYHMLHSPLRDHSLLIIDKGGQKQNNRTWCFWANQPTLFDHLVYRTWNTLHIAGDDFERTMSLRDYQYNMIRGADFVQHTCQVLSTAPNVTLLTGVVKAIEDTATGAHVTVGNQTFSADWVFDSTYHLSTLHNDSGTYHELKLHFRGWEIETPWPVFHPQAATLMDFRTPQDGDTRFFYVLPFSPQRALVEFTVFSHDHFQREYYEQALQDYVRTTLGISDYRIVYEEAGVIPATDRPFPRYVGQHVMTIGMRAGMVKPTTGYAFMRIQQDSAAIVRSLLQHGHPSEGRPESRHYRWLDSVMLQVMQQHGEQIKPIFAAMFQRNPITRILRFLDEAASPWEQLRLIGSLPPWLFVKTVLPAPILAQTQRTAYWQCPSSRVT